MNRIDFFCVFCGASMSAKEDTEAAVLPCPACSHLSPVPPPPGTKSLRWTELYPPDIVAVDVIFHCPKCDARLGSDARTAGTFVYCPPCGTKVKVPHLEHLIVPAGEAVEKTVSREAPVKLTAEEVNFLNNVTLIGVSPGAMSPAHASQR
jgi:DNA-directed RNA polymerase subunit RPC12/RpoP